MQAKKTVLVPIADGFEEIETIAVVDILRRAEMEVTIASVKGKSHSLLLKGANGISILTDGYFEDIEKKEFDVIVIPGGLENAKTLGGFKPVIDKLKDQKKLNKWYTAICASPNLVFEANGILDGEEGTCYPMMQSGLKKQTQVSKRVVVSHHCITSQAPGTAVEFALGLVENIISKAKADELKKAIVA